jgi:glycosyltransferase involved in cell wall biosynthesis
MYFSIVVPTFSRPDEVTELLNSLVAQQHSNFEVIIVDGSLDQTVKNVVEKFQDRLKLQYLYQKGLGISESRNRGVEKSCGKYIIFFDSDCVIPPAYFKTLEDLLADDPFDAFGGPDKAGEDFNKLQKAVSYAMTSFFTTGGIRGRKKHVGQYQPRTFNMGIRKDVFLALGGFSGLKVSEDIDLSMRLYQHGYRVGLLEQIYVFHKRRSTFYKFFRQVFSFGSGRIDLQLRHRNALKVVHVLPSLFVIYNVFGLLVGLFSAEVLLIWLASVMLYALAILVDATLQNHSIRVGLISVYASFIMLTGYGLGMLKAFISRIILKSDQESQKPEITKY